MSLYGNPGWDLSSTRLERKREREKTRRATRSKKHKVNITVNDKNTKQRNDTQIQMILAGHTDAKAWWHQQGLIFKPN